MAMTPSPPTLPAAPVSSPAPSPVADAIRQGFNKLSPQDRQTLVLAMTPPILAIFAKMLGPEVAGVLARGEELHQQAQQQVASGFAQGFGVGAPPAGPGMIPTAPR